MSGAKEAEKEKTDGGEPKKRGRRSMFTDEQKQTLLKYYDDGMTSTNRQYTDMIEKCAKECQTTVDRVKRFIGAENYKRKKAQGDDADEAVPKSRKRKTPPKSKAKQKKGTDEDEEEEEEQDEEDED